LVGHDLLESVVLFLECLEPLGLVALHAAVLAPPATQRGFADLERLQDLADALVGGQPASMASTSRSFLMICSGECRRRFLLMENPSPELALDFHNPWIRFWGAFQWHGHFVSNSGQ